MLEELVILRIGAVALHHALVFLLRTLGTREGAIAKPEGILLFVRALPLTAAPGIQRNQLLGQRAGEPRATLLKLLLVQRRKKATTYVMPFCFERDPQGIELHMQPAP